MRLCFPKVRLFAIQLHWLCDALSGTLLLGATVFGPWALGTTEGWSIWTMNCAGIILGILLGAKLVARRVYGFGPARRENLYPSSSSRWQNLTSFDSSYLTRCLAILTLAICGYCLASALNARSSYRAGQLCFIYHPYLTWLPHSLDAGSTWFAFWTCVGLTCSFWSFRDWLLGKSWLESTGGESTGLCNGYPAISSRLRRLLWLLSINGALLGLEGVLQRLCGTGKLLFVVKPRFNPEAVTQFGPYAYRGNAAEYFNLLWPVCLGFWWILHRLNQLQPGKHHVLLGCASIVTACPIISTSRGGALITFGLVPLICVLLVVLQRDTWQKSRSGHYQFRSLILIFLAASLGLGLLVGWKSLQPRLCQAREDLVFREEIYEKAKPMASDYPWFGTGPGTFEKVFQFYRISSEADWPAQLHNDWLETRITFGWIGTALLALALCIVLFGSFSAVTTLAPFLWVAMAGILAHARFDFPFQVHSIAFLFVVYCAILSALSSTGFENWPRRLACGPTR